MASPSTVITLGYGSFGSVNLLPTLGYGVQTETPSTLWHDIGGLTPFSHKASGEDVRPIVIRNTDVAQVYQSDVDQ